MREIRTSGSEGGGAGNSTGSPYPYQETFFGLVCVFGWLVRGRWRWSVNLVWPIPSKFRRNSPGPHGGVASLARWLALDL